MDDQLYPKFSQESDKTLKKKKDMFVVCLFNTHTAGACGSVDSSTDVVVVDLFVGPASTTEVLGEDVHTSLMESVRGRLGQDTSCRRMDRVNYLENKMISSCRVSWYTESRLWFTQGSRLGESHSFLTHLRESHNGEGSP